MQEAARIAIQLARARNLYIVIDADGLYVIQDEPALVRGYRKAVLTPNVVEFKRLCDRVVSPSQPGGPFDYSLNTLIWSRGSIHRKQRTVMNWRRSCRKPLAG
jgi:hypothetical protein